MQVLKFISENGEVFFMDYDIWETCPLLISMQPDTGKVVELEFTEEEVDLIIEALQNRRKCT